MPKTVNQVVHQPPPHIDALFDILNLVLNHNFKVYSDGLKLRMPPCFSNFYPARLKCFPKALLPGGHLECLHHQTCELDFFGGLLSANDRKHLCCLVPVQLQATDVQWDHRPPFNEKVSDLCCTHTNDLVQHCHRSIYVVKFHRVVLCWCSCELSRSNRNIGASSSDTPPHFFSPEFLPS